MLSQLTQPVPRPRALVDPEGFMLEVNPELCSDTGYTAAQLRDMRLRDLADLDHADRDEVEFRNLFDRGADYVVEKRWVRADGFTQTRLWSHARVETPAGLRAVVEWLPAAGTQRANLAEREIAIRAEQLRRAEHLQVVGRVAGGVAHDFNNLLSVILGYSELLLVRATDERLRDQVDMIHSAGQRLAELTRKLLAMERWSKPEPRRVALREVLDNALRTLRRVVPESVELVTRLDGLRGEVHVDPVYAEVALLELANNAVRAMPDGGRITLEAEAVHLDDANVRTLLGLRPGRYLQVCFSDSGQGMARDAVQRLLLACRGEDSPSDPLSADPLGAVRRFVSRNGGAVWPYSEPGIGTTVKLYLPEVSEVQEPSGGFEPPASLLDATGDETVLVVEDADQVRILFAEALEASGYTVLSATDGAAALEQAQAHDGKIDLVITDMVMPRLNGPDLVRELEPSLRSPKVIYASGFTREALAGRVGYTTQGHFITKPVTPSVLLRKVREVLDA
ncbi:MAG: response regulator [Planctomycetota bacterium]